MSALLDDLVRSIPRLWRGSRLPDADSRTLPTGFSALDGALPGGGWPIGAVVELLIGTPGIGELRLLLPTIRNLTTADNHVLLVDPPYLLNAVLLRQEHIELDHLLVIGVENDRDALWSTEQALRNPACGAVLIWVCGRSRQLTDARIRRLQVAAQDGQSILFLSRMELRHTSQWAALRLELLPAESGLRISVLKAIGTHHRPEVCVSF